MIQNCVLNSNSMRVLYLLLRDITMLYILMLYIRLSCIICNRIECAISLFERFFESIIENCHDMQFV